jgi:small subunit ribosomal protein S16
VRKILAKPRISHSFRAPQPITYGFSPSHSQRFYRPPDSRKRRDGRYIEQIGTYDPMIEGENYQLDLEKADKWLGFGAKASTTVASIIKKVRNAG